jgi:hypothetical protein
MIEIKKYTDEFKKDWDELIDRSRIDSFLFYRDFMDYHSERFNDYSFLIYKNDKLEGVLPGNINNYVFYSHQGLTYGGLIYTRKLTTIDILEIFQLINKNLKDNGVRRVIYKPIPYIYHSLPSDEQIYALFKSGAEKIGCNISSTIFQKNKIPFNESRKSGLRKAKKKNLLVVESDNFDAFWNILESNLLVNHKSKPVHSLSEIKYLKSKFQDNIKLYVCRSEYEIVGGCVLFVMKNVVHVQYISAGEVGKQIGALDCIFDELINKTYKDIPVFDFGQSTEDMGNYLNESLIFQKEGFGGRGIVYETYKYELKY